MKIDPHNFFFHPFALENKMQTALSTATILALSILTGGLFAIVFAFVNWRDRNITVQPMNPKVQNVISPILKNPLVTPRLNSQPNQLPNSTATSSSPIEKKEGKADQLKVTRVKQKQFEQLQVFEKWAKNNAWQSIHDAHYDWWMFPVERPSAGQGDAYAVGKEEVKALQADPIFMANYRRGVALVVKAWGWDLETGQAISSLTSQASGQNWTGYGVRLAKMSDSLKLFGEIDLHKKLQLFFTQHCLPQQNRVPISNLAWLNKSLLGK